MLALPEFQCRSLYTLHEGAERMLADWYKETATLHGRGVTIFQLPYFR